MAFIWQVEMLLDDDVCLFAVAAAALAFSARLQVSWRHVAFSYTTQVQVRWAGGQGEATCAVCRVCVMCCAARVCLLCDGCVHVRGRPLGRRGRQGGHGRVAGSIDCRRADKAGSHIVSWLGANW